MLRKLDENLWVAEQPLTFMGLKMEARMTVIRLADGALWVHSPLRLTPERRQAVEALGPVRFLVAPNMFHHLFIGDWMTAFPQARAFAAPGLPEKRKDLSFHAVLSEAVSAEWAEQIDVLPWRGAPMIGEVVFFHRASRTLIVTDCAHNIGPDAAPFTRFVFKTIGGYGRLSTSVIDRVVNRDRAVARANVDSILKWDIQRVIVAHGHIVEQEGARAFRAAYEWL
ncbi:DUF4336 domain-containing protein [Hyalangium rubrum]|uniref:DUF4336 domain-containing protein n=1 Tax=Hyalangium rubrum TaxID=3103134 RepID=A0ABU5HC78_9BACT|nr:DUF4336 domain-containing protein [Hyalangium sp. s54d21]MDY7231062.1 DUF4336 domain-containing protein [Hyalangium sp. s54d21]